MLVASLHQGISDLIPTRLEFYENWLNPVGTRNARFVLDYLAAEGASSSRKTGLVESFRTGGSGKVPSRNSAPLIERMRLYQARTERNIPVVILTPR